MTLIAVEPIEHVPYANRATTAFVFHTEGAFVWLDQGDRADLVTVLRAPFQTGGPASVERVLTLLAEKVAAGPVSPLLRYYAEHVAPVVRACLPWWGAP